MSFASTLNTIWMRKCQREESAFTRAMSNVAQTQASVLSEIVGKNAESSYGRRHRFDCIDTPARFQRDVPITQYEDYASYVDRIADGESGVLTGDPVRMLEPTSGTTSAEKLIPYTDSLKRQFQRGVDVWIADLFRQRPAVRRGRAYWSISPAMNQTRMSAGGLPIGFDDDLEYLGAVEKQLARSLLAVPQSIGRLSDIDSFRYGTLLHLVLARDLSLISVWSPTYLSVLMRCLETWSDQICFDIRSRKVSLPGAKSDSNNLGNKRFSWRGHRARADEMESVFKRNGSLPEKLTQLWPRLALISCWADAGAAPYVSDLGQLFPEVEIQPKGLLATEGFVSIPLVDQPGAALAVRSHFFEFVEHSADIDHPCDCRLAHELQHGRQYRVLLTTGGGLYRYQMHDVVEVVGFRSECPLLRFVGKSNLVSDAVGEKLGEPHVREVFSIVTAEHNLTPKFMLLTLIAGTTPRYRLYLQAARLDMETAASLRSTMQLGLQQNPYFRQAIELQQLAPLEVCVLDPDSESGSDIFQRVCMGRGQKVGDIKCNAIDTGDEWADAFEQHTLFICRG